VLKSYNSDPLNWHDDIPLQLETSINSAGLEVYENAESLEVPFLLLQGTADKIVDSWGPREIHLRARSTDKTYIEFKGFYHELLNEPEKMVRPQDGTLYLPAVTSGLTFCRCSMV
jgi:alpha-beta hydrolase superfamily lysophospholipase